MKPPRVTSKHVCTLDSHVNVLPQWSPTSRVYLREQLGRRPLRLCVTLYSTAFVSRVKADRVFSQALFVIFDWILRNFPLSNVKMYKSLSFELFLSLRATIYCYCLPLRALFQVHTDKPNRRTKENICPLYQTSVAGRVGIFTCVHVVSGLGSPLPPLTLWWSPMIDRMSLPAPRLLY